MLKNHADAFAGLPELAVRHRGEFLTVDHDAAGCRAFKHVDAADERGFACTAESDDSVDFAACNLKVDSLKCFYRTRRTLICFFNMRKFNHGNTSLTI